MQVKVDINNFVGMADLSGAEVEVLNRIFAKLSGVTETWLDNDCVTYTTGEKPTIEITMKPTVPVITKEEYDTREAAVEARAKAMEEAATAERVAAVERALKSLSSENCQALVDLIKTQGLSYYKEDVGTANFLAREDGISWSAWASSGKELLFVVTKLGKVTRKEV